MVCKECVRYSLMVAGVQWCMSSGDKPQTVDLADTPERNVDVEVRAF